MRICENGTYRNMTEEEIAELRSMKQEEQQNLEV